MKKVIISGANGFIGSSLANFLHSVDYAVTGLVRPHADPSLLDKSVPIIRTSYTENELRENLRKQHILIHCAALTKAESPQQFKEANIDLTKRLLSEVNLSSSISHFIFLSSQAAIGPGQTPQPKKEEEQENPVSFYGKSKLAAEKLVRNRSNKNWTIIRPAAVFGPGDRDFLVYFRMLKHNVALIPGTERRMISLLYAGDLVQMIKAVIENPEAGRQVFNACDGHSYDWRELAEMIGQVMGKKIFMIRIPLFILEKVVFIAEMISRISRKSTPLNRDKLAEMKERYWLLSSQKVENILNYKIDNKTSEKLKTTYEWYREKKWLR